MWGLLEVYVMIKLRHGWNMLRRWRHVHLILESVRHYWWLKFIRIFKLRLNPILLHVRKILRLLELRWWKLLLRRKLGIKLRWLLELHLRLRHGGWLPILLELLRRWLILLLLGRRLGLISISVRSSSACFTKWILIFVKFLSFFSLFLFLF